MRYIYAMGYYWAIKRMKYCHWGNMDGLRDYHIKWSKSDRERQIYGITYMESKKRVQMNLFTKQKWSYGCRKQTYGY